MMFRLLCAATIFVIPGAYAFATEDAILGYWYTAEKETLLEIYEENGQYHGRILWLAEPRYPEGDPDAGALRRDRENPDPEKRDVPIIGLVFIEGLEHSGDARYKGGRIYNPDNGKTYKCTVQVEEDRLKLRGFIGISALGRTEHWTRPKANDPVVADL